MILAQGFRAAALEAQMKRLVQGTATTTRYRNFLNQLKRHVNGDGEWTLSEILVLLRKWEDE